MEYWERLCQELSTETDPQKLTAKLEVLETLIVFRSQELSEEEKDLRRTSAALLKLRVERLGWPAP